MRRSLFSVAMLLLGVTGRIGTADSPAASFESLQQLILPSADDSQWMSVSWQPAANLWAAREKAAAEGKPLFLWYMAGEPLGAC
jgi:hypothetical protein